MSVYFLAYRGKSPLSRLIRFFTAGDYSHIGLAVQLNVQGYDASVDLVGRLKTQEKGDLALWSPKHSERPSRDLSAWGHWYKPWDVKIRAYVIDREHEPGTVVDIYKLPCTGEEAEKIFAFYREWAGAPYDWLGALTSIVRPTEQDKKRWFCSEIAYAACLSAGVRLLNETRPHKVTPRIFCLSPYLKRVGSFVTGGTG